MDEVFVVVVLRKNTVKVVSKSVSVTLDEVFVVVFLRKNTVKVLVLVG